MAGAESMLEGMMKAANHGWTAATLPRISCYSRDSLRILMLTSDAVGSPKIVGPMATVPAAPAAAVIPAILSLVRPSTLPFQ